MQSLAQEILPEIECESEIVCPPDLVADISLREVKKMVKDGKAILVDVREEVEFKSTPAINTIHIPIDKFAESSKALPISKTIFFFCRGAYYSMANPAVELLCKEGYRAFRLRETSYQLRHH